MNTYTIRATDDPRVDEVISDSSVRVGTVYITPAAETPDGKLWVAGLGTGGSPTFDNREAAYRAVCDYADAHPGHVVQ